MNTQDIFDICLAKKLSGGSPAPTPTYEDKTLTPDFSNGDVTVSPDTGYDALSSVTIQKDADLVAENIKKDVEVFGITGTLESGIPAQLQTDMDAVFNKKFSTSTTYPSDTWADTVNEMGVLPTRTASGAIASFSDGADDVPIVDGVFNVTAVQSGSGDPSPSNVRPISGWSAVNVTRLGKNWVNIADYNVVSQVIKQFGGLPAGQFVLSFDLKNTTNIGGTLILQKKNTSSTLATYSITANEEARVEMPFNLSSYTEIQLRISGVSAGYRFEFKRNQIEYGTTATDYAPYTTPTNYGIDLGGTIYGGSLNLTTGVLTVNYHHVDCTSITWSNYNPVSHILYVSYPNAKHPKRDGVTANIKSNMYKTVSRAEVGYSEPYTVSGVGIDSSGNLFVSDINYSNKTDAENALNNVYLVYELATPITYQLTPTQINTLLGANNIYCDTGDSSVTYRADIDLLIAELEG